LRTAASLTYGKNFRYVSVSIRDRIFICSRVRVWRGVGACSFGCFESIVKLLFKKFTTERLLAAPKAIGNRQAEEDGRRSDVGRG
jgi:hypothetical protein